MGALSRGYEAARCLCVRECVCGRGTKGGLGGWGVLGGGPCRRGLRFELGEPPCGSGAFYQRSYVCTSMFAVSHVSSKAEQGGTGLGDRLNSSTAEEGLVYMQRTLKATAVGIWKVERVECTKAVIQRERNTITPRPTQPGPTQSNRFDSLLKG